MWLILKAMGSKTELYELFVFHSETCLCRGAVLNAAFQTPVEAYVGFFWSTFFQWSNFYL